MTDDTQWNEVGGSFPSCSRLYVRDGIVGAPGAPLIAPPLVLVDTRTSGTSLVGTLDLQGATGGGATRITLKPTGGGPAISEFIRWRDLANINAYTMGDDFFGDGKHNWFLIDSLQGINSLYFASNLPGDTASTIRWSPGGFIAYEKTTEDLRVDAVASITQRIAGATLVTLTPTDLAVNGAAKFTAAGDAVIGGPGKLVGFFGQPAVAVPHISAVSAATDIGAALIALGLAVTP